MRKLWPGLVVCALAALAALALSRLLPPVSPHLAAVVLGALVGNLSKTDALGNGFHFAARTLLRFGVVLLGLRLALPDLVEIGLPGLGIVLVTVATTFFGARWLAGRMGVSEELGILIGTGYAICGVSAVVAMSSLIDADEEEASYAIGLVTLAGSLSIIVLPLFGRWLGLPPASFGAWAGAAVHDVAQTVATAASFPEPALESAIVVKLTRVALLAPLVLLMALSRRRDQQGERRPPLLPVFVLGFLAMVALRSTGILSASIVDGVKAIETALFAISLVGVGAGVDFARLRGLGGKPLRLGLLTWLLVAVIAFIGVNVATIS